MSIFTVKDTPLEVKIPYMDLEGVAIFYRNEEDAGKFKSFLKYATAIFERPKLSNFYEYTKDCVEYDEKTKQNKVDLIKLGNKKITILLKKLIDADGNEEIINPESAKNILPELAMVLSQKFDDQLEKEQEGVFKKLEEIIKEIEDKEKETQEIEKESKKNDEEGSSSPKIEEEQK